MKSFVLIVAALSALGWAGCTMMQQAELSNSTGGVAATGPAAHSAASPATNNDYLSQSVVKSEGPDGKNATPVESAIAWSEKYSQVSEELVKVRQDKKDLEDKNQKLVAQLTKIQNDQDASQKELTEANQLLLEMRQDLEKWKTSVIGFREEMRSANKAQLEATRKVIILLGGEVTPASAATTQPTSAAIKIKKGDSVEASE